MLKQRIMTALALMSAILVALFYLPVIYFQCLLIAIFSIGAWEWSDLSGLSKPVVRMSYAVLMSVLSLYIAQSAELILLPIALPSLTLSVQSILGLAGIFWAFALLWVMGYPGSSSLWGASVIRALMGPIVIIPTVIALLYLLGLENGEWLFLYVIGIVASADIGAYFAGRRWGNAKLAAKVSPGKSWAGFWGGVFVVTVYSLCISQFTDINVLSMPQWLAITLCASLASVLGDLLESMLKRHRGIKDSSQLLPGHGGILDRVDSMTAAAPIFVLLLMLLRVTP